MPPNMSVGCDNSGDSIDMRTIRVLGRVGIVSNVWKIQLDVPISNSDAIANVILRRGAEVLRVGGRMGGWAGSVGDTQRKRSLAGRFECRRFLPGPIQHANEGLANRMDVANDADKHLQTHVPGSVTK